MRLSPPRGSRAPAQLASPGHRMEGLSLHGMVLGGVRATPFNIIAGASSHSYGALWASPSLFLRSFGRVTLNCSVSTLLQTAGQLLSV